ncbi:hypothetical protein [Polyangium spumosum]|uniref:Uncharacterized protein n=1 Tax=Polyangium spumosum TaxID=889282 RepID=A0A6N7PQG7_9BACT|nr:hypothetical protein [Polyangium spumosum]MRG93046.1 hypothetical protein [Polyangium spumosum]
MRYSSLLRAGGVVLTAAAIAFAAGCNVTVNAGPGGPGGSGGAGGEGGEGGVSQGGSGGAGGEGGVSQGGSGGVGGEGGFGGAGGGGGEGGIGGAGGGGGGEGGFGGAGGGGSLPACNDGTTTVFAIDKLLLGETDPDGTPNYMAWKHYGMNLDGVISTKDSVGLCQPASGGHPAAVYPDGNEGKDNSFGKNILPIILALTSDYSSQVNQEMQAGKFTYLLAIEGLGASTSCAATSKLYRGDNLAAPQWDGTDAWPLGPDFLLDPADPASAKNVFLQSVIEDDVYRSGPEANFNLVLGDGNDAILSAIPIRHARLEMKLSPGHDGAIEGQLGGIIDTEAFLAEIAKTAAKFDDSFCDPSSPTLQSIMNQIRQGSDIMKDGTQDPTKTCDGISIGIGFTMKAAHLGAVAPPDPPPVDPCAP